MDEAPEEPQAEKSGVGATIGITLVVLLLALGAVYFFLDQQQKINAPAPEQSQG